MSYISYYVPELVPSTLLPLFGYMPHGTNRVMPWPIDCVVLAFCCPTLERSDTGIISGLLGG